jgi:hypothetical protein
VQSAEYLVVLEVVGRVRGRERQRMYQALRRPRAEVDTAIEGLEQAGVLAVKGARVYATPALRRLDELNLISV